MSLIPVESRSDRRRRAFVSGAAIGLACLAVLSWTGAGSAWAAPPSVPGAPGPAVESVKELTRAAELIFRGTVQRPGAANLDIVEAGAETAIVRVDEVLAAAASVDDFTGREITVFLRQPDALRAGDQRVFFTSVGLVGETLGVLELGSVAGRPAVVKARVAAARGQILEEALRARVAAADLVISGRVLSTKATYAEVRRAPLTEHDPNWWEAVVQVRRVVRGRVTAKTVSILYPSSRDAMWAFAPKPGAGEQGTWLLHRYPVEGRGSVYAVLGPQDQMTREESRVAERWVKP